MKKLVTIALTIALIGTVVHADPTLEVLTDPLPGGLNGFTFSLHGNDGELKSFATTNLTFNGAIQQIKFANAIDVNDETTADSSNGVLGYDKALDTWLFNGWTDNSGAAGLDTSLGSVNGDPVILSVGSATGFGQKDLVYIVADGDVDWAGGISRLGADFDIAGSTGAGGQPGESQENPIMPDGGGGPEGWNFDDVPGGGNWFDPPLVPAYLYQTTDGLSNFTHVQLPTGIPAGEDGMFLVNDGTGGVPVAAGALHAFGPGINSFIVSGIAPDADAGDPVGFPTFLQFDQTTVSFTQTGIPEPATMGLMLFGAIGMIARKRR